MNPPLPHEPVSEMPPDLAAKVAEAYAILDQALAEHHVTHMFGLFSGGHDSLCATHLASKHPKFSRAAHIHTTIGIEETRWFVRDTSIEHGFSLIEYKPPVSYRDIVLKHGFPGPGSHRFMYARLKERCVRTLVRVHKEKRHDRIMLVTGVRLSESTRRMGHVLPIKREGAQLWVAPILNWTDEDKLAYIKHFNLKRNPVVDKLCMSGECLCGAFAKPEELAEIMASFPETAAVILDLQKEAEAAGVHCKWGKRPPGGRRTSKSGPMCHSCDARNAAELVTVRRRQGIGG